MWIFVVEPIDGRSEISHKVNRNSMTENKIEHQKKYWEKERRSPEHPVIEAFASPKINYIRDYVNLSKNTKLLDVGCGNGFFTICLLRPLFSRIDGEPLLGVHNIIGTQKETALQRVSNSNGAYT